MAVPSYQCMFCCKLFDEEEIGDDCLCPICGDPLDELGYEERKQLKENDPFGDYKEEE